MGDLASHIGTAASKKTEEARFYARANKLAGTGLIAPACLGLVHYQRRLSCTPKIEPLACDAHASAGAANVMPSTSLARLYA